MIRWPGGGAPALAFLLIAALAGCVQPSFQDPPLFWTCEAPPPLRPNTPAVVANSIAAKQAMCSTPRISGMQFNVGWADASGNVPAGQRVLQTIRVAGINYESRNDCGDDPKPFNVFVTMYFETPALQPILQAMCCERQTDVVYKGTLAFLPLPASAQPAVPGLGAGLAAQQFSPQHTAIMRQIDANATLLWGFHYEHDSCHPPGGQTSCGGPNCLDRWHRGQLPLGGGVTVSGPLNRQRF